MFDFGQQFPDADSNGFIKNWALISNEMKKVLKEYYRSDINTLWTDEVEQLLILMKILPARASQKTKKTALPFVKAIDRLIVFSEVCFDCHNLLC